MPGPARPSPAAGTNALIPGPKSSAIGIAASAPAIGAASQQNPVFKMMGMPNIRFKLPSRNWLIFLSVTGSFTAAVLYDKYHKKRNVQKWCDRVSQIAGEPLSTSKMPRRITIYLSAPPGDGLRPVREHFYEYVKPVLVAGALDWDVVEGRREGDVRWAAAERIRRRRRTAEGHEAIPPDQLPNEELKTVLRDEQRRRVGTTEHDGVQGDLVVGRNAWKEYVRGVHEGWLGPLDAPKEATLNETIESRRLEDTSRGDGHASSSLGDVAVKAVAEAATTTEEADKKTTDGKPSESSDETPKPKKTKPDPYIATSAYESMAPTSSLPELFDPVTVLPFPHILGFLNTPIRVYRFLNRRRLADDIGRQTAALVLGAHIREFEASAATATTEQSHAPTSVQQGMLLHEEQDWSKKVRQRKDDAAEHEDVLIDPVVVDARVTSRMRTFVLSADQRGGL